MHDSLCVRGILVAVLGILSLSCRGANCGSVTVDSRWDHEADLSLRPCEYAGWIRTSVIEPGTSYTFDSVEPGCYVVDMELVANGCIVDATSSEIDVSCDETADVDWTVPGSYGSNGCGD